MTRVYIAAPLPLISNARTLASGLAADGLEVVSTWHQWSPTVEIERAMPEDEQATVARQCLREIESCSALVLIFGSPTERHGSIAEAFYALGIGRPVVAIGTTYRVGLPTILLRGHSNVRLIASSLEDAGAAQGVAMFVRRVLRQP